MAPTVRIDDEVYDALKSRAEPFVDTPNTVLRRLLGLERPLDTHAATHARAKPGELLNRFQYDMPILTSLARRGGSAPANDVLGDVEAELSDRLTERDREPLNDGTIRWRNRAMWRRFHLARDGRLKNDSPRGVWELTEAGFASARDAAE